MLEKIAEAADDRVVAPDGLPGLGDIRDVHTQYGENTDTQQECKHQHTDFKKCHRKIVDSVHGFVHFGGPEFSRLLLSIDGKR